MPKFRRRPKTIEAFVVGVDTPPPWFLEAVRNGQAALAGSGAWILSDGLNYRVRAGDAIVLTRPGLIEVIEAVELERDYVRVVEPGESL